MTTIFTPPPSIGFTKRPIPLALQTDRLLSSRYATIVLEFTNIGPSEGDYIDIKWNYYTAVVRFTFTASPALDTDLQLQNGLPTTVYALYVAQRIRENLVVLETWSVAATANKLVFSAKEIGLFYTLVVTSANITILIQAQGTAAFDVQNLSAYVRVVSEANAIGAPLIAPFSTEYGIADFDLASVCAHLKAHLPTPTSLAMPLFEVASDAFMKYELRYGERFGTPAVLQATTKSPIYTAIFGNAEGFGDADRAIICHNDYTLYKKIASNQPDFCYVYLLKSYPQCFVRVLAHLSDNTDMYYRPHFTAFFPLQEGSLYYFSTGFQQLGLHGGLTLPKGVRVLGYDVQVVSDNSASNVLSEPFTIAFSRHYNLDYSENRRDMYLLFDTGMGGMETLRLTGAVRTKYSVEHTEIENANGERDTYLEEISTTYEATFLVLTAHIPYYRNVLRSQLWLCDAKKQTYTKVIRITKDFDYNPKVPYNYIKIAVSVAQKEY